MSIPNRWKPSPEEPGPTTPHGEFEGMLDVGNQQVPCYIDNTLQAQFEATQAAQEAQDAARQVGEVDFSEN